MNSRTKLSTKINVVFKDYSTWQGSLPPEESKQAQHEVERIRRATIEALELVSNADIRLILEAYNLR